MQAGRPRDAMGHLVRALRLGAPLDVEFEVYMARRAWDSQARAAPVLVCVVLNTTPPSPPPPLPPSLP